MEHVHAPGRSVTGRVTSRRAAPATRRPVAMGCAASIRRSATSRPGAGWGSVLRPVPPAQRRAANVAAHQDRPASVAPVRCCVTRRPIRCVAIPVALRTRPAVEAALTPRAATQGRTVAPGCLAPRAARRGRAAAVMPAARRGRSVCREVCVVTGVQTGTSNAASPAVARTRPVSGQKPAPRVGKGRLVVAACAAARSSIAAMAAASRTGSRPGMAMVTAMEASTDSLAAWQWEKRLAGTHENAPLTARSERGQR